MDSGCPFGGAKPPQPMCDLNTAHDSATHGQPRLARLPTGKARVRLLYEEYIHLSSLRAVWESPITESPFLEPCFAAGFHGIELGLLLLAEFLADQRDYVAKRPRVERVADDIATQCKLLADVIDGELEEESTATSRLSLTQEFPFPGAPPTADAPSWSPGLARTEAAVREALPAMTLAERNSIVKTVLNLTGTAFGSFQRWSVGLGVEPQLNSLRVAVGLPVLTFTHTRQRWLDYAALVRPEVAEATLTAEKYVYHEDFFFRTVHLGTECWGAVALARLRQAAELAADGVWAVATARVLQAAKILDYLGAHLLLLTSMNLRDYLRLKVELEGTSGEGSAQVKAFRPAVTALMAPLAAALLPDANTSQNLEDKELALGQALMEVYEFPDRPHDVSTLAPSNRELYNYAKALEDTESGLLGGFFFRHYQLAANVIGSDAKGTMRRAVVGLKSTYETPVFPLLDRVRSGLGAKADVELAAVKGRMMQDIIDAYLRRNEGEEINSTAPAAPAAAASRPLKPLEKLYSWDGVPSGARAAVAAATARHAAALGLPAGGGLPFLDHAWGKVPPAALHAALEDVEALYSLGNPAWDALFGSIMPEAAGHVLRLLGVPESVKPDVTVHFGHNSHELVFRLLSQLLVRDSNAPLRLLTSDSEFYSFTRQINRLVAENAVHVTAVASLPAETFAERCIKAAHVAAAEGAPVAAVYLSQVTSLTQQTLLPDLDAFVPALTATLDPSGPLGPLLIIDGYHSFAALPAPLAAPSAALGCCFLGGVIKHAGAGANCAFITVSRPLAQRLRPVNTGWLADTSVLLAPGAGVNLGDSVGYDPDLALQGGTPAMFLPLLTFNHIQRAAVAAGVGTAEAHAHVAFLQRSFLARLASEGPGVINLSTLLPPHAAEEAPWRSHTLVFAADRGEAAAAAVAAVRAKGVLIDCRGRFVRVGFGPNHTDVDVDTLLRALG